jgi:hypothetical protein
MNTQLNPFFATIGSSFGVQCSEKLQILFPALAAILFCSRLPEILARHIAVSLIWSCYWSAVCSVSGYWAQFIRGKTDTHTQLPQKSLCSDITAYLYVASSLRT